MSATLSLIIPFYNEYAYLADCLDSVAVQRLGDRVEVIIVNDAPGDRANAFVEAAAAPHGARVIHHEVNRGLSAARNTGLDAATGDLVSFLDSDDYYTADGLVRHLAFAEAAGAEMTHTPTIVKTLRGVVEHVDWDRKFFQNRREGGDLRSFPQAQFIASSWSSIYRRAYLEANAVRFDEAQKRYEDRLFVLHAAIPAASISFIGGPPAEAPVRVYRRRPGSITTASKADEDRALQAGLSRKCVDLIAGAVAEGRLSEAHLQRELLISFQRLVFHTGVADPTLAPTAELAEARRLFQSVFADHALDAATYADPVSLPLTKVGHPLPDGKPVGLRALRQMHDAVRVGDWGAAGAVFAGLKNPPAAPQPMGGAGRDARLVLHIGMHKTGTTHVQRQFEAARPELLRAGVLFPETGFRDHEPQNARAGATPGHVLIDYAIRNANADRARELTAEIDASGAGIALLSCENLSNPLRTDKGRAEYLAQAEDFFAALPRRRVVALHRRPDMFLDRYFREVVALGLDEGLKSADRFAMEYLPLIADLPLLFRRWGEFAGGDLHLADYDDACAGGVGETVLRLAGADAIELPAAARTYASPGRSHILAAQRVAAAAEGEARSRALGAFLSLSQSIDDPEDGPLLSRRVRMIALETLANTSAGFAADHGLSLPVDRWMEEVESAAEPEMRIYGPILDKARVALDLALNDVAPANGDGVALAAYRFAAAKKRRVQALF